MKMHQIVYKEIFQRNSQLISSLIAISLGIALIVGIKNISVYSEKAVASELDALGANILILPKSSAIQDYYSADYQDSEIPESYINILLNSDLQGLDNLSPKLSMRVKVKEDDAVLTGILPKNEFKAKAVWQGTLGIFSRPAGCGTVAPIPGVTDCKKTNYNKKRIIDDLGKYSLLVGSDIANRLKIKEGDTIKISGSIFNVEAILPPTGTVEDGRLFTHLRTVQKLSGKESQLNVIEIVGCCSAISGGLIMKLNKLLPDAKVVTITQIVQTQLNTNSMMKKLSILLLIIILFAGGAGIANYMYADVFERRREIGIYMSMGATPAWIIRLFLYKAAIIGFTGGLLGFIIGTALAVILGPKIAGIPVNPIPLYLIFSILGSILLSILASIFPAVKASRIDPVTIIQEDQ